VRVRGSIGEVFRAFLKLGLTSFGGPIAHLGYFREEFVARRRWLDDAGYADLVALSQFLPGPTSSQVGFALGLMRAGVGGAFAAFAAFTLPSVVIMVALAAGAAVLSGPIAAGVVHGLTLVAVAIVAHAVWGMARTLAPDPRRATIAAGAALLALVPGGSAGQLLAIALGAAAGLLLCRGLPRTAPASPPIRVPRAAGAACLAAFTVLALALPLLVVATGAGGVALFDAFFRAGSLVFGGGHVVLPLLETAVVDSGWLGADAVLTGYGAAQALPGPLFTFAAYLGALVDVGPGGVLGAGLATAAIFLPGLLLLVGVLPFWGAMRRRTWAEPLLRGANAAVVGILGAALYTPLFTTAIGGAADFVLALGCFVLLSAWRWPSWAVVLVGAAGGLALSLVP